MPPTHANDETDQDAQPKSRGRTSLIVLVILFVVFLLIAFLPPLVNVSRFQQRIATNISNALGRPVHFDQVSLTLLPLPGFTMKNFVIDEDPAFGSEPILRADEVQVTLRISSLWHPHVEFSKIAFTEPSVNLVRAANGRWSIEGLLLLASHIQAAPTSQRFAGPARRFPYIEATGARLNLKLDQEKTPVSFTDADFALWLPEPHQWHLRLEAHPVRTDASPGDTGTIRVEGTLGGADLNAASLDQIPIDLHGDWQDAQLGGVSRLLLGGDPGLRGEFSVSFGLLGTVGHNTITTDIKLAKARRADFVPAHLLSLEIACKAVAGEVFHSFTSIECHWPPSDSSDPSVLIVTGNLPDVRQPGSASAGITVPALPADTLFDWLSVASPHPPAVLEGAGTFAANLAWGTLAETPAPSQTKGKPAAQETKLVTPVLSGELELSGASINVDPANNRSVPLGDVVVSSAPQPAALSPHARPSKTATQAVPDSGRFDLQPVSLALGGKQPATLEGRFDAAGYTLHLTGTVIYSKLLELASAVPQFGDGLIDCLRSAGVSPSSDKEPATTSPDGAKISSVGTAPANPSGEDDVPVHVDLTATRVWGSAQVWRQTAPSAPNHPKRR